MNSQFHPHKIFKYCPKCGGAHFISQNLKAQKCNDCNFEFYTNSAGAVAAIITDSENRVLLTTRKYNPFKGFLDLPGGFIDPFESAETALYREIKEELHLDISEHTYFGSFPNEYVYGGILYYTIDLVFVCKIKDMRTIEASDDVADFSFHAINSKVIENVGLESIKMILKTYAEKKLYCL